MGGNVFVAKQFPLCPSKMYAITNTLSYRTELGEVFERIPLLNNKLT